MRGFAAVGTTNQFMRLARTGITAVFASVALPPAIGADVRFGAAESWGEPLAVFENGTLVGGVNHALMRSIARELGLRPVFVSMSRNRMRHAMATNEFDVRCYTNPQWVDNPDDYAWSDALFWLEDRVIAARGKKPITKLQDLHGVEIGAVLGYKYPTLDPLVASQKLIRADVPDQGTLIRMLEAGRLDYVVSNSLAYDYYASRVGDPKRAPDRGFAIDRYAWRCAVLKSRPGVSIEALNEAIARLTVTKEVQEIVAAGTRKPK